MGWPSGVSAAPTWTASNVTTVTRRHEGRSKKTEEKRSTSEELTDEELQAAEGEELPPREQMSLIREPGPHVVPGDGFTFEPIPPERI